MSGIEIVVVVCGLLLGYWIVSKFLLGERPDKPRAPDNSAEPGIASAGSPGREDDA